MQGNNVHGVGSADTEFGPSFELAMQEMEVQELEGMEAPSMGDTVSVAISAGGVSISVAIT